MPRGSRPGERRGGRKRGTRNKRTVEAELLAKRVLDNAPVGAIQNARLGKETLEKFMILFDALAEHYRTIPQSPHSDEAKFTKYATAACECAKALAPYQSPTYRAIVVSPPPPEQQKVKRFTLTIFDRHNGSHVLAGGENESDETRDR